LVSRDLATEALVKAVFEWLHLVGEAGQEDGDDEPELLERLEEAEGFD
jgi:hypothetical protein